MVRHYCRVFNLKFRKNSSFLHHILEDYNIFLHKGFIYFFGVLRRFQHCTGHITMGSWKGRGNLYIQFIRVLYCKLPTNGKQLPAFPLEAVPGTEPQLQRWEARVLPLCHRGPSCIKEALLFLRSLKNRKLLKISKKKFCSNFIEFPKDVLTFDGQQNK